MTIEINQAALTRLLESPQGQVQRGLQLVAGKVVVRARHNVDLIMHRAPVKFSDNVDSQNVPGLGIVIGIRDHSTVQVTKTGKPKISAEQYLANKELKEFSAGRGWLVKGMREVFPQ